MHLSWETGKKRGGRFGEEQKQLLPGVFIPFIPFIPVERFFTLKESCS